MSQQLKVDLRGKECSDYILELARLLITMKPGDILAVLVDQDRIICTHQLLRNSPKYLFKWDIVGDHAEITIRRLR